MKNIDLSGVIATMIACVTCVSCQSGAHGNRDATQRVETDTIQFSDSTRIVLEIEDLEGDSFVDYYDITFIVPRSKEMAADSIREKIRTLLGCEEREDYRKMGQESCRKYFDEHRRELEEDFSFPWGYRATFELVSQSPEYLTVVYDGYDYRGGAHGMPVCGGFTVLRDDAHILTWSDFSDNPKELLPAIEKGFCEDWGIYLEEMFVEDFKLTLPASDPWIEKDSIIFLYQPYEIGAFAMGTPRLEVGIKGAEDSFPDDVIKPLIKRLVNSY